jgi:hypothetical protein
VSEPSDIASGSAARRRPEHDLTAFPRVEFGIVTHAFHAVLVARLFHPGGDRATGVRADHRIGGNTVSRPRARIVVKFAGSSLKRPRSAAILADHLASGSFGQARTGGRPSGHRAMTVRHVSLGVNKQIGLLRPVTASWCVVFGSCRCGTCRARTGGERREQGDRRVVPLHDRPASLGAVIRSTAGVSHSDMNEFERRDSAKQGGEQFCFSDAALFLLFGLIKARRESSALFARASGVMTISRTRSTWGIGTARNDRCAKQRDAERRMIADVLIREMENIMSDARDIQHGVIDPVSGVDVKRRFQDNKTPHERAQRAADVRADASPAPDEEFLPEALRRRPTEPLNRRTGRNPTQ